VYSVDTTNYKTYILKKYSRRFLSIQPDHGVGLISQHQGSRGDCPPVLGFFVAVVVCILFILDSFGPGMQVPG